MKVFVTALMLWISAETGWPIPEHPSFLYLTNHELRAYAYGCDDDPIPEASKDICAARKDWDIDDWEKIKAPLALYNHREQIVVLNKTFNIDSIHDQSVLLHELVHHMQNHIGVNLDTVGCKGDLEKEAYELQNKWLKEKYNLSVFDVIAINELFLMIITSCGDNMYFTVPDPEYQNQN